MMASSSAGRIKVRPSSDRSRQRPNGSSGCRPAHSAGSRRSEMPKYNAVPLVYDVAARFVESCLRRDDSLFTPGRPIWTLQHLDELDALYVQRPELGEGGFEEK